LISATASLRRSPALPAAGEHRQIVAQARHQVAHLGGAERQGVGHPALRHRRSRALRAHEAGFGDGEAGGRVALKGQSLCQPLHRPQCDVVGAGALCQLDRAPGLARGARPIAGAVGDVAAPPGRFGTAGVAFGARRQRLGQGEQRLDVLELWAAPRHQVQRALARGEQPPAQVRVAGRREGQGARRACQCLLIREGAGVMRRCPGVELGGVGSIAGLRVVLGRGRQQGLGVRPGLRGQPIAVRACASRRSRLSSVS
jgi:hypothetical protein